MAIHPIELQKVRKAIRSYLVLEDDDPIDLVLLAGVLANFAEDRDVPVWLVIVGNPGSAKTELVKLIKEWRPVWPVPDSLTEAYWFSAKTGSESALERIKSGAYRILYMEDMGSLMEVARIYAASLYQQFRGIHDGFLKKETGYNSRPQVYGIELPPRDGEKEPRWTEIAADKRLGWIGAATAEFYAWQTRHSMLGSRFMSYYWAPLDNWQDYELLTEIQQRRAEKAHYYPAAKAAVERFLDMVVSQIGDAKQVKMTQKQTNALGAGVKLVHRVTGTRKVSDTGARLHARVVAICRMMAFISGRDQVGKDEMAIGERLITSHLPRESNQILQFAMNANGSGFHMRDMLLQAGGTRRVFEPMVEGLIDVGILQKVGTKGRDAFFSLSSDARRLVDVFRKQ